MKIFQSNHKYTGEGDFSPEIQASAQIWPHEIPRPIWIAFLNVCSTSFNSYTVQASFCEIMSMLFHLNMDNANILLSMYTQAYINKSMISYQIIHYTYKTCANIFRNIKSVSKIIRTWFKV